MVKSINWKNRVKRLLLYGIYMPLRKALYQFPNLIFSFFPMKNIIVMESNPDLACNTYELYRYIITNNCLPNFKIIWRVSKPQIYNKDLFPERVSFVEVEPKRLGERVRLYYIINRAKILVDCNRHYERYKTGRKQLNIYLDHGMPLKDMINKYGVPLDFHCDYIVSQAKFFNKYLQEQYGLKEDQIFVGGVPRNDQFFKESIPLGGIYNDIDQFDLKIAWVPTFRKIMNNGRTDCVSNLPLGIPILYTKEDILKLENKLKEVNGLLIIKPHPVQDLSVLKDLRCSHIRVLYNEDMLGAGVQTNELLKQCDAMITDYSGIYYDYLLTDRPIGITLDDYEEYSTQKGFVFDDPLNIIVGFHIYTLSDMLRFVDEVVSGNDEYLNERKRIKLLTNDWIDGNSAKRTYEFIEEKYVDIWK